MIQNRAGKHLTKIFKLPSQPKIKPKSKHTKEVKSRSKLLVTAAAGRLPIDFALRHADHSLDTKQLLEVLRKDAPRFRDLAGVIGERGVIAFPEKQPLDGTTALSQFEFN